ncbi:MAG TPA: DNA repair protein RecN [Spirochaetota bacterium]|nr:DNA repair protein RecN [Spirochaetota bacterium]HOM39254.1 DNA repair protein RecN [Spirochaetota bacterium]HPQ49255.1 DNA repair protein RecN [Spirochaetota bacterium]
MLKRLKIKNIAIIEDVEIEFDSGFNVITGETGAGKSIIVNSISFLLGEQIRSDVIRGGENYAKIEAVFEIEFSKNKKLKEKLESFGIDTSENVIIIEREVDKEKGSKAFINNKRVLVQTLKDVTKNIIDFHGQHQNQSLLEPENHIDILDSYGRINEIKEYKKLFNEAISLKKEYKLILESEKEQERFYDFAKYAIDEIDSAKLKENEDVELKDRLDVLINIQNIYEKFNEVVNLITGDDSAIFKLKKADSILESIKDKEKGIKKILPFLKDSIIKLEPVIDYLKSFKYEFDPNEIKSITERIEIIDTLKRKYGNTINDILNHRNELEKKILNVEASRERLNELERLMEKNIEKLKEIGLIIHNKRKDVAKVFEENVKNEFNFLNMENSRIKVEFEFIEDNEGKIDIEGKKVRLSKNGVAAPIFLISTNKGEDFKHLNKIASGGEISRIMLALKSVLRMVDPVPIMVFDEIDAGIGGNTAFSVGEKLKQISSEKQVICITHLPQIASKADKHFKVEKIEKDGRTNTIIRELNGDEVVEEISRLLSGDKLKHVSIEHAKEFIKYGKNN